MDPEWGRIETKRSCRIGGWFLASIVLWLCPTGAHAIEATRFPWNLERDYVYLVDGRDHRMYRTVEIDSMNWFAENLKYVVDSSWCYGNDTADCGVYGRLYSVDQAEKACPKGWHLPTADEWRRLFRHAGEGHAMTRLVAVDAWPSSPVRTFVRKLSGWIRPIEEAKAMAKSNKPPFVPDPRVDDRFGFRLLPGGMRIRPEVHHVEPTSGYGEAAYGESNDSKANPTFGREFGLKGSYAYLWASTSMDTTFLAPEDEKVGISIFAQKSTLDVFGFSVRCVENRRGAPVPADTLFHELEPPRDTTGRRRIPEVASAPDPTTISDTTPTSP